jgi:hypothetical protein
LALLNQITLTPTRFNDLDGSAGLQDVISIFSQRSAAIMQRFGGGGRAEFSNNRLLAALRALDEVDAITH